MSADIQTARVVLELIDLCKGGMSPPKGEG
jgi:hypothetical protein